MASSIDDFPRVEERVGRALSRGNLRQREGACDLDKVAALGAVGISEPLADAVFRLKYANDPKSYDDALGGMLGLAHSLDNRHGWRLKRQRTQWMARRVLDYWLADVCLLCTGVGYEVIQGSPHLSDRACPACHGERKRPMPWVKRLPREPEGRHGRSHERYKRWQRVVARMVRLQEQHRTLLVTLENVERRIGEKMIGKLAAQVRSF